MYRRYFNEYEKKAQQISEQKCEQAPQNSRQSSPHDKPNTLPVAEQPLKIKPKDNGSNLFGKFRIDDILLIALILLLLKEEKKDMELILALGFIFICDFNF